jgi:heme oxygenase
MLSEKIKDTTKQAHLNLEKIVVQQLKSVKTNKDYAGFLTKFYTYFSNVEKAIAPYITNQVLPDYAERRNSTYIKRDIEALGTSVGEAPVAEVPVISNAVSALGALYVMEGSIMGGRIIVQILEKLGIKDGISFFSGYGQETGTMWAVFLKVMNEAAVTADDERQAIDTANRTFELFGKVF